jgi:hypothetical protein
MRHRLGAVLATLLADARVHRLQTVTSVAGVAVGIAVIVAIRLASGAALTQFRGTYSALTGVASHQLTGVRPLSPARLLELRADPAVKAVQPVVAATLIVPPATSLPADTVRPLVAIEGRDGSARSLRLVGIDPFQAIPFLQLSEQALRQADDARLFTRLMTEPGLVALGPGTCRELGLADGDSLSVLVPDGRATITVALLDEPRLDQAAPPFALADIAVAQELLGLGDGVLRYDLVLDDGQPPPALHPGERLEPAATRGERADSLTDAFASNLMCLGLLAVLVGAYLVFSMGQFAVSRRRALLGRLRCLGCPALDLRVALLLEAALLALAGVRWAWHWAACWRARWWAT